MRQVVDFATSGSHYHMFNKQLFCTEFCKKTTYLFQELRRWPKTLKDPNFMLKRQLTAIWLIYSLFIHYLFIYSSLFCSPSIFLVKKLPQWIAYQVFYFSHFGKNTSSYPKTRIEFETHEQKSFHQCSVFGRNIFACYSRLL